MFCGILGQDIRRAFTGPLVHWFRVRAVNQVNSSSPEGGQLDTCTELKSF